MKPVEPGCRVMYIGKDRTQFGATGVAAEYVEKGEVVKSDVAPPLPARDGGWMILWDKPFRCTSACNFTGGKLGSYLLMYPNSIMRIDGDVEDECEADEISRVKEFA